VIHNPADRLAKLMKQLRGMTGCALDDVHYVNSPISEAKREFEREGRRPLSRSERRYWAKYNRRHGGNRLWGPGYQADLGVKAEKPERALRKALAAENRDHAKRGRKANLNET
jgi:hypothetical protein